MGKFALLRTGILVIFLVACGVGKVNETATPTPLPATPVSSSTSTHAPLPTLTASLSPTAVAPLSQTGPWLLLRSDYGMWVINSDGTGLTQIANYDTDPAYQGWLSLAIAPHGGRLAYFYPSQEPGILVEAPPELMLITLPSVSPKPLTPLHSRVSSPTTTPDEVDPNGDVWAVLTWGNNLAWSPDGSMLAFVGAPDGPTSDLYVYSTRSGTIKRLTSGPTQAIYPSWSPDGRYILSAAARTMNFGVGGSNGPEVDKVWAVRPDGSDLRVVQTFPNNNQETPALGSIEWVNNQAYIESFGMLGCGAFGLTFVDFLTPHQYTLLPGPFSSAALAPGAGILLIAIPDKSKDYEYMSALCGPSPQPGWYLMSVYGNKSPQRISLDVPASPDTNDKILTWSPQAKVFFASISEHLYAVDLKGKVTAIDVPNDSYDASPVVSPNGQDWAIPAYEQGLWITSLASPARQVFIGPVTDALWTPDGAALLFTSDDVLYRAAAPDYQPVALANIPESGLEGWMMP
ncbi:MAG TPA: hypothetical protein VMC09_12020 [Anaerolineales bacterium]|nr:hypothetical protein [Anaerolineales bacterium]